MKGIKWTPEMMEKLRDLIDRGFSHRDCSQILGMSRNAIIGKCNRMGLIYFARTKSSIGILTAPNSKLNTRRVPRKYLIQDQRKITFERGDEPESLKKTLFELGDNECRYPQDKINGQQVFCGHPSVMGTSYCKHHFHVCFNISEKRKQPTPTEIIEDIDEVAA